MTSITKMLILITVITAISGKAPNFSNDTDRPSARVSYRNELLDTLKMIAPKYDELEFIWQLWTKLDVLPPSLKADTTNTKSIVSQHGHRRKRREALVKTRFADDRPDSVMSLTSSNYPLNVARFPNGDVVNYSTINIGVVKWIHQRLIIETMNRIRKSMLKTGIIKRPQT